MNCSKIIIKTVIVLLLIPVFLLGCISQRANENPENQFGLPSELSQQDGYISLNINALDNGQNDFKIGSTIYLEVTNVSNEDIYLAFYDNISILEREGSTFTLVHDVNDPSPISKIAVPGEQIQFSIHPGLITRESPINIVVIVSGFVYRDGDITTEKQLGFIELTLIP